MAVRGHADPDDALGNRGWLPRRIATRDVVLENRQEIGDDAVTAERGHELPVDVDRSLWLLERPRQ